MLDETFYQEIVEARRGKYDIDDETPEQKAAFYNSLDKGIAHYVRILAESGIETCQSCEGGKGHSYPEPTVAFQGGQAEAWKAYSICIIFGLPVSTLRQIWQILDGVPTGPIWELVFWKKADDFLAGNKAREEMVLKQIAEGFNA